LFGKSPTQISCAIVVIIVCTLYGINFVKIKIDGAY
jgi:hypothetical protein